MANAAATVQLITSPISMRVNDDFPGNLAFVRQGVHIGVYRVGYDADPLWSREVWERPVWFRWYLRPYGKRIEAAKRKARAFMEALR